MIEFKGQVKRGSADQLLRERFVNAHTHNNCKPAAHRRRGDDDDDGGALFRRYCLLLLQVLLLLY